MPRTYIPEPGKKQYKKYDPQIISKAVQDLENSNDSLQQISIKYGINKSVLYRHSKKNMKRQGGQTALSHEVELHIIENMNKCGEWGYPMDSMDLRFIVKMYLDKLKIKHRKFKNNFPGPDFVQSFLKRHKNKISQRICENIKRVRAAVSPDTIQKYFTELKNSLEGVPPSNIINYDETNLSDDPGRKKVIMKRGCKYPERVVNHSKSSISLMMAGTAEGNLLPPYVVYKAAHLYDTWVKNGPAGTRYNTSSSGWFEGVIFEDWVEKVVIPYFRDKPGRKCLIGDNLSSHLSVCLIKSCKEQNIDFVFLTPNSTHITQPLDVAFFRPMKRSWRELLLKWKKTDGQKCTTVPKGCFPKLLKILIDHLSDNAKNNLLAGFKKTGISPLNKGEILSRLPQENNIDANKSAVDDSVLDFLKQMRYGTMDIKEPKRKRKLEVVPGRSCTAEDAAHDSETQETVLKKPKKTKSNSDPSGSQVLPVTKDKKQKAKGVGKKTKAQNLQSKHTEIRNANEISNKVQTLRAGYTQNNENEINDEEIQNLQTENKEGNLEMKTKKHMKNVDNEREYSKQPTMNRAQNENKIGENYKSEDVVYQSSESSSSVNRKTKMQPKNIKIMENKENENKTMESVKTIPDIKYTEDNIDVMINELDIDSIPFIFSDDDMFEEVTIECENDATEDKQITKTVKDHDKGKRDKIKVISDVKVDPGKQFVIKDSKAMKLQDYVVLQKTVTKKTDIQRRVNYYNKSEEILKLLNE